MCSVYLCNVIYSLLLCTDSHVYVFEAPGFNIQASEGSSETGVLITEAGVRERCRASVYMVQSKTDNSKGATVAALFAAPRGVGHVCIYIHIFKAVARFSVDPRGQFKIGIRSSSKSKRLIVILFWVIFNNRTLVYIHRYGSCKQLDFFHGFITNALISRWIYKCHICCHILCII